LSGTTLLTAPRRSMAPCGSMPIRLVGCRVAVNARAAVKLDVEIAEGRVCGVTMHDDGTGGYRRARRRRPSTPIDLSGYLLFPGLINAHDHLEFNLFPKSGKRNYASFEEWAKDIYHPEHSPLKEHLAVPKSARLWWGAVKNLLSGVTTVCHHNPFEADLFTSSFPVQVVSRYGWAHSLAMGKNVTGAFRSTPPDCPFIIHLAEGTDSKSRAEIFELNRLGALDSRTVIVHGVGLDAEGHKLLQRRGAGLVWCPTSNLFTLGKTLDCDVVNGNPRIALGSDSALTAEGDLLDEIPVAMGSGGLSEEVVYSMVTTRPAELLRLCDGEGNFRISARADLFAIKDRDSTPARALLGTDYSQVEFAMVGGVPRLASAHLADRLPEELLKGFEPIAVGGVTRLIQAPVGRLLEKTRKHLGNDVRLAGRLVEG
jgi:cytosine/adenosine deaminase-related metal-dependent hydrolase